MFRKRIRTIALVVSGLVYRLNSDAYQLNHTGVIKKPCSVLICCIKLKNFYFARSPTENEVMKRKLQQNKLCYIRLSW